MRYNMKIDLSTTELNTFLSLCYLGHQMATINNTNRNSEYDRLIEKIFTLYLNTFLPDYNYDELMEELSDELEDTVAEYEYSCLPYILSKLLAEKNFPLKDYNDVNTNKHLLFREHCEHLLENNGIKCIQINL